MRIRWQVSTEKHGKQLPNDNKIRDIANPRRVTAFDQ